MPEPVPQPGMDGLLTDPELRRRLSLTGAGFHQPPRRMLVIGPAPFHRGDQLQGGLCTAQISLSAGLRGAARASSVRQHQPSRCSPGAAPLPCCDM